MSDLGHMVLELIQLIKTSDKYKEYQEAREILSRDKEKYDRANHYRKECYRFQTRETPMSELEHLTAVRKELVKDYDTERYILSENELCRLVQKIIYGIVDELDIEIAI